MQEEKCWLTGKIVTNLDCLSMEGVSVNLTIIVAYKNRICKRSKTCPSYTLIRDKITYQNM